MKNMSTKQKTITIPDIKEYFNIKGNIDDFVYLEYTPSDKIKLDNPFQIIGFAAGICLKGSIEITVGHNRFTLHTNDFIVNRPHEIIQIHKISKDFEFELVAFSESFMNNMNINVDMLLNSYIHIQQKQVVTIKNKEAKDLIMTMFDSIHKLTKFYNLPHYKDMIQHYVYAFLFAVSYIFGQSSPQQDSSNKPELNLMKRFFALLQKEYKGHRTVKYYADKLFITPKYLSKYIKKLTGQTASDWIKDIVLLEAKMLLSNKNMTIQEVSNELNFPDQTAFGKFFKKNTGLTPKEYKASI